jgi:hypothetical protein
MTTKALEDLDPAIATPLEVLVAVRESLQASVADREQIIEVARVWSEGRSDEQAAVMKDLEPTRVAVERERYWLAQIEKVDEIAGALLASFAAEEPDGDEGTR